MKKLQKLFFSGLNYDINLTTEDYKQKEMAIKAAAAIAHNTNMGVYVLDYFLQDIVFISENIYLWCGLRSNVNDKFDYDKFIENIPSLDLEMLYEINKVGFEFLHKKAETEDITKYTISYDFRLNNTKKGTLVNQHFSPIIVKNYIWLAICTITISNSKSSGNILMINNSEKKIYEYSLKKHCWVEKKIMALTDNEKNIIHLSAQGYTIKEISELKTLTQETVKSYRKNLMRKLRVNCMNEAIRKAIIYGLIP